MLKKLMTLILIGGMLLIYSPEAQGGSGKPSFGGGSSGKPAGNIGKPSFGGGASAVKPNILAPVPKPAFSGGSSSPTNSPTNKPSFGGGSTSPPKLTTNANRTPISVSQKPAAESFDKISGIEARKVESRQAYQKSETSAPNYKTPAGKEVPIVKNDKTSDYLRGRLDETRWQNRYQRTDVFYHGYAGRPIVAYNDYYHPMWNYWLLGQTMDVMSLWVYHHQMSMDAVRLNSMYAQNADLRMRVDALERQGVPRDVTYTPKNVDPDLMFDEGYVNAVYNPKPRMVEQHEYKQQNALWVFLYILLLIVSVLFIYWIVFLHRF